MKIQVARIDENGLYLEPVLVEQNGPQNEIYQDVLDENGNVIDRKLRSDIVLDNVPQGLHNPKWNGTEWIEGKASTDMLEMAKQSKLNELDSKCKETILGYFDSTLADGSTYSFSYDAEAQANFNKVGRAFDKALTTSTGWTAYLNGNVTRVTLDATDFDTVFVDSLGHVSNAISKFRDTLEPQVKSATTISEVESVVW